MVLSQNVDGIKLNAMFAFSSGPTKGSQMFSKKKDGSSNAKNEINQNLIPAWMRQISSVLIALNAIRVCDASLTAP